MQARQRNAVILLGLVLLLASVLASPYWTVHQIRQAAKAQDADALANYVDFSAVKAQLKAQLQQALMTTLSNKGQLEGMEALGTAMVDAFVGPMVDALVSPASLGLMLQGQSMSLPMQPAQSTKDAHPGKSNGAENTPAVNMTMGYESVQHFYIALAAQQDPSKNIRFILSRTGVWTWQVTAIQLPTRPQSAS